MRTLGPFPVPGMGLSPGAHSLDMNRALKVVAVLRFARPAPLAGPLAGRSAIGLRAVLLAIGRARIGPKQGFAAQALASLRFLHCWSANKWRPASSKARARTKKTCSRRRKRRSARRRKKRVFLKLFRKKIRSKNPHFQTAGFTAFSDRRWDHFILAGNIRLVFLSGH